MSSLTELDDQIRAYERQKDVLRMRHQHLASEQAQLDRQWKELITKQQAAKAAFDRLCDVIAKGGD